MLVSQSSSRPSAVSIAPGKTVGSASLQPTSANPSPSSSYAAVPSSIAPSQSSSKPFAISTFPGKIAGSSGAQSPVTTPSPSGSQWPGSTSPSQSSSMPFDRSSAAPG